MITAGYIRQNLDHLDDDLLMYSSCYSIEGSIEILNNGNINDFEAINGIHYNESSIIADYSFDNIYKPETIGELHAIIDQYYASNNVEMGRYIDDGYVYATYKHCFYNDKVIVFV